MAELLWTRTEGLAATPEALALLDEAERAANARFLVDRKRHEHLVTRVLVRTVLGERLGVAPASLRFVENPHGRPLLDPPAALHFNITHTEGWVGVLLSAEGEVGCDVEALARAPTLLRLSPTVFAEAELAALRALPEAEQPERAVRLWTLKESYIKARGKGLALSLQGFAFHFDAGGAVRLEVSPALGADGARWAFETTLRDGYVISTAVERLAGAASPVQHREVSLPVLRGPGH